MPEGNGNGNGIEASLRGLGALKFSGRDVLLAGVLMALGAAAITVQYLTFKAYAGAIRTEVARTHEMVQDARAERQQILSALRAQTCAEALGLPTRTPLP